MFKRIKVAKVVKSCEKLGRNPTDCQSRNPLRPEIPLFMRVSARHPQPLAVDYLLPRPELAWQKKHGVLRVSKVLAV